MRTNLILLLLVLGSAFYLVHTQYESRRLYTAVDKASAAGRKLDAELAQLQVQKRELSTPERVQQLASKRLKMRPVNPAITEYVQGQRSAGASAVAEGGEQ
ncbi:cell division protein FtsL [Hydrogenophaga sp. 5NK40-0174]|uniref:cell division protein FtsL n=1 Tax=Hydrogenophaga sp. 5NK40-0174 TaxID=3127649 RepID=UPI003103AC25